jgi:tRNA(Ile)-lysidine synthetase-like protein
VHSLAQRVLSRIRRHELLHAGDRVGVAVSGGIDSVALLRLLLELRSELGIVLSIVHFNHKLRGAESDADEQFVANLAHEHGLEFHVDSDDVAGHASEEHVSIETAARELRYGFFRSLLEEISSGAKAPDHMGRSHRSAESAAPPKSDPLGLKPISVVGSNGAAGSRALSNLQCKRIDKIVTGHTLDDQAETVLMRMIRGAGTRGLGGIHPRIAVEDDDGEICGEIVRPLLEIRRCELEQFLKDVGQDWHEDSSNSDNAYTRNRVRKLVVPLLEKEFNPAIAENLAELAAIARDEEDYWENEVAGWMGTAVHWSEPEWAKAQSAGLIQIASSPSTPQGLKPASVDLPQRGAEAPLFHDVPDGTLRSLRSLRAGSKSKAVLFPIAESNVSTRIENAPWLVMNASVSRMWFLAEPVAVQRRLIKAIGEEAGIPLEFKHVEEIRRCAEDDASGKEVSLPLGWTVLCEHDELVFVTPDLRRAEPDSNYEYNIPIPGQTTVAELNSIFEVVLISAHDASGYKPDQLLGVQSLVRPLKVRNWRPGDRFWPAHTKSSKKIKELLQELHVAQPERKLWPVVVSGGDDIVWMRGLPTPAKFQPKPGQGAVLIVERPIREES